MKFHAFRHLLFPVTVWFLLVTIFSLDATAQRLSEGVAVGFADPIPSDPSESMDANPSGLAFGEKLQLSYAFTNSGLKTTGDGHALFASLGLLGPYKSGFGVQALGSTSGAAWPLKLTWAHALRLGARLSIGFAWHGFRGNPLG